MDKKLVGLMLIFMLAFGLFATITVFNKPLSRLTRAKEESLASSESSLIFAWPLTTTVNTKVNINVFVRNALNVPLVNKNVTVSTSLGTINNAVMVTDKGGKSTFILESNTPGIAQIKATVDGTTEIKQKISIQFE
ncbi:MAG: hypothetical protein Q7R95_02540 [bacterium]|nr:hypothetical protein [bacterium]